MRTSHEIGHFFVANMLDIGTTLYGYHFIGASEYSPVGSVMTQEDGDISRYLILKTAVVALLIGLSALSKVRALRGKTQDRVRWDFVYSKGITLGTALVYTAVVLNSLTIISAS